MSIRITPPGTDPTDTHYAHREQLPMWTIYERPADHPEGYGTMMRAQCAKACGIFDVVALPLPVEAACRAALTAYCPICGNRAGNLMAPSRALTEAERERKAASLARSADAPPAPRNDGGPAP